MKQKLQLNEYICITLLSVVGLFSKRLFFPAASFITNFLKIPGGSMVSGFSFLFLILGVRIYRKRHCGLFMGVIQGTLAFFLGMSSFHGPLSLFIYGAPGLVLDLCENIINKFNLEEKLGPSACFTFMGMAANMTGSIITNTLFFRLHGILFLLWMLISAFSGGIAGFFAHQLASRLPQYNKLNKDNNF